MDLRKDLNHYYRLLVDPVYRTAVALKKDLISNAYKTTLENSSVQGSVYLLGVFKGGYLSNITLQDVSPNIFTNINPYMKKSSRDKLGDLVKKFAKQRNLTTNISALKRTPYSLDDNPVLQQPVSPPSVVSTYQNF